MIYRGISIIAADAATVGTVLAAKNIFARQAFPKNAVIGCPLDTLSVDRVLLEGLSLVNSAGILIGVKVLGVIRV